MSKIKCSALIASVFLMFLGGNVVSAAVVLLLIVAGVEKLLASSVGILAGVIVGIAL